MDLGQYFTSISCDPLRIVSIFWLLNLEIVRDKIFSASLLLCQLEMLIKIKSISKNSSFVSVKDFFLKYISLYIIFYFYLGSSLMVEGYFHIHPLK